MKKLIIVCALITVYTAVNAQNTIVGRIAGSDSLPLIGATVWVPDMAKGTVADTEGAYELSNMPSGSFRIEYSYIGYASKIKTVVLSGSKQVVNIGLDPSSIESEEIVVTGGYNATQHENAVKIDILKINEKNSRQTPTFMETLTKIPGVDMISKGSGVSKPVIRGLSMNDILVLSNGVRYENYQYSSHHPLGIDEFGIAEVEVVKGPASLLYGSDAIGGVINFIKESPAPSNTVTGDFNTQFYSNSLGMTNNLGVKATKGTLSAGIRLGDKTNADYLQGGGDYVPNSRFHEYSVKTNAGHSGTKGRFWLYYDYNRQNLGMVEDEAVEEITKRGRSNEIFYQQLSTHLVSSQNKFYLGKMKLDADASYQNTELIHFGEAENYEIQMRLATVCYETKLYLPAGTTTEYIVGLQGINQFNTNVGNRETTLLPDAAIGNYSVFALLQHALTERIKLQTGIRTDYKMLDADAVGAASDPASFRPSLYKKYNSASASIGATYTATERMLWRANIASAYRTPNLAELTSNGRHETRYEMGDAALAPENSYEADLSTHYHWDNMTADLAVFYNDIRNYIFIAPTGETAASGIDVYRYMQGHSYLYGGEAAVHIHPRGAQWLHIESSFASVTGMQRSGDYLPFVPADKLSFELRAEKKQLAFMHKVFASGRSATAFDQTDTAPDETATSEYTLIDLSIGGALRWGQQDVFIVLAANNIFDCKYVSHLSTLKEVSMYDPGRNIAMSVKIPFGATLR